MVSEIIHIFRCCFRWYHPISSHLTKIFSLAPNKPNQDAFVCHPNFCNSPNCSLFGVFDGHGSTGDICSIFAKNRLPHLLQSYVKSSGAKSIHDLSDTDLQKIYTRAFVDTNQKCHEAAFDDTLSGTTAITVMVVGKYLYVANVGDSRAIICSESGSVNGGGGNATGQGVGKIMAEPLSIDQTPFRKDERERVKRVGARVLTIDQIEGLEPIHENWGMELGKEIDEIGDPPRLWNVTLDKPGTAFTRSIGDAVAESIGVFAEPEHLIREITPGDKYIIICSDGVFEFLTSQAVCDMVGNFDDPLDACRAVVQESYRLWLQYEVRTDDITMIALYLGDYDMKEEESDKIDVLQSPSTVVQTIKSRDEATKTKRKTESSTLMSMVENKPVRRNMSKAKRRMVMDHNRRMSAEMGFEEFAFENYISDKTKEEFDRLAVLTKANFLFQHLLPSQLSKLYSVFEKVQVEKGDIVIKQGDQGDKFYVVDKGSYEVTVRGEDGIIHVVMTYTEGGSSFGELSLMYGKPRAATVTAVESGVVWALARPAFKSMLMRKVSATNLIKVLKKVDILKNLPIPQLQRLCDVLGEESFKDGDYVVKQGDVGERFYIISSGEFMCTTVDPKTKAEKELQRLKTNDYFGERSLLMEEPRACNVVAVGKGTVYSLTRGNFLEVVGDLHELIRADQEKKFAQKQVQSTTTYRIAKHTIQGVTYGELEYQCWTSKMDYGFMGVFLHKREGSLAFQMYTVRAISKRKAIDSDVDDQIVQDRDILALLSRPSPFVPVILASFSDSKAVYSVYKSTVVCQLNDILSTVKDFNENDARFYSSCVIMALDFLHEEGIMHRKVTPECVWITSQGYGQLGDLGCSKEMSGQQQFTMIGDPSYFAPEQVLARGHTHTVDFWSFGVLIYEMLTGTLPFGDSSTPETELYKNISGHSEGNDPFKLAENADNITAEGKLLVNTLLNPDPKRRLGSGMKGVEEIKEDAWLKGTSWTDLTKGRTAAPHAMYCTEKIQINNDITVEKDFFDGATEVAHEDCPEGFQAF